MKLYSKLLSHKALSNFRIQGYISEPLKAYGYKLNKPFNVALISVTKPLVFLIAVF